MNISNDFQKYGGSYLLSETNTRDYIYRNDPALIGRPDGQFMIPSNQMDELLEKHPNDPRAWEKQLGLWEGSLGEYPIRVDVYYPEQYNLRSPTPDLSGSNDKFVPDGKTAGGYDEAIITQFPNPALSGNESIGKITPVEIDHSLEERTKHSVEALPPDRRPAWPPNSIDTGICGPSSQDIPPIQPPHSYSSSPSAGPDNLSSISQNADKAINAAASAAESGQNAAKSLTGGLV